MTFSVTDYEPLVITLEKVCPKLLFQSFLTIFNKIKHTCQLSTIEIDKRKNNQGYLTHHLFLPPETRGFILEKYTIIHVTPCTFQLEGSFKRRKKGNKKEKQYCPKFLFQSDFAKFFDIIHNTFVFKLYSIHDKK